MAKKKDKAKRAAPRSGGARRVSVGTLGPVVQIASRSPAHRAVVQDKLRRLHELSNRVGGFLRHHSDDRVRLLASLVVVGGLVTYTTACDQVPADLVEQPQAEPEISLVETPELTEEVAEGLPAQAGQTYAVKSDSIYRDHRGIYHFEWMDPQSQQYRTASASQVQLVQSKDQRTELTMTEKGEAILVMPADTPVWLAWPAEAVEGQGALPTATPAPRPPRGGYGFSPLIFFMGYNRAPWYPMSTTTGGTVAQADPTASQRAYRDPPSGSALEPNQPIRGSTASTAPKPLGDRVINPVRVSGMNRGTGQGQAVTGKASSAVSGIRGGSGSGTAASGKSGVTSGKSGATSGVKAPSSGSFSGGKAGSSGGGSASS